MVKWHQERSLGSLSIEWMSNTGRQWLKIMMGIQLKLTNVCCVDHGTEVSLLYEGFVVFFFVSEEGKHTRDRTWLESPVQEEHRWFLQEGLILF